MRLRRGFLMCVYLLAVSIITYPAAQTLYPLLILLPDGELFEAAKTGLEKELRSEFAISTMEVNDATRVADIDKKIASVAPRAVVLMGNSSIRLYAGYAHDHRDETASLPVVAILALDIKRAVADIGDVHAIAYETPMVTALVNFRRVINKPVATVGVVYREAFEEFVTQHTEYCKKEKIAVKSILIGDDASSHQKEISKALKQLVKKERVQAFWVPNDNILLKPELLMEVWLPLFSAQKVSVIVGVESLVKPELNFGTFAVIPDPVAMGEQAAGMIADLKDEDWKFDSTVVYPAISMYSVLNLKKAVSVADVKSINVNEVTRVLSEKKKQR